MSTPEDDVRALLKQKKLADAEATEAADLAQQEKQRAQHTSAKNQADAETRWPTIFTHLDSILNVYQTNKDELGVGGTLFKMSPVNNWAEPYKIRLESADREKYLEIFFRISKNNECYFKFNPTRGMTESNLPRYEQPTNGDKNSLSHIIKLGYSAMVGID